jgi:putative ABC transport system substrate-binding protein
MASPKPMPFGFVVTNASNISFDALDLETDPLAKGYVKSLARPGGNLTGMYLDIPELSGKQVELLKQIVPRLTRSAPSTAGV